MLGRPGARLGTRNPGWLPEHSPAWTGQEKGGNPAEFGQTDASRGRLKEQGSPQHSHWGGGIWE
jgi:hypothetical protein